MRKLDGKFHIEGDKLIKTANGEEVPLDEPVFVIRGRDRLAVQALLHYKQLSQEDGCNDYHFDKLNAEIKRFVDFSRDHPERMKQPSITRGL